MESYYNRNTRFTDNYTSSNNQILKPSSLAQNKNSSSIVLGYDQQQQNVNRFGSNNYSTSYSSAYDQRNRNGLGFVGDEELANRKSRDRSPITSLRNRSDNSQDLESKVNTQSYYYEHQILKVWDQYIQNQGLYFWLSQTKDPVKTLFSQKNTMSLDKQAGILLKRGKLHIVQNSSNTSHGSSNRYMGSLYQSTKEFEQYSISVCGPVSYDVYERQASINDLIKAFKQINKWSLLQSQKIKDHVIMFPYNFNGVHWCLGLIKMNFTTAYQLECAIEIYNPLPQIGDREVNQELVEILQQTLTKIYSKLRVKMTSQIPQRAITQQNDYTSCGVISAENGKDILDGSFNYRSQNYSRGAFQLRLKHLSEVNDPRFTQIQQQDENVYVPQFDVDREIQGVLNLLIDAFSQNKLLQQELSSKYHELQEAPTQCTRKSAQIVRDLFQQNKRYFSSYKTVWTKNLPKSQAKSSSSTLSRYQMQNNSQAQSDEQNLYDILFKENKSDLEFQDETINILQLFTEKMWDQILQDKRSSYNINNRNANIGQSPMQQNGRRQR
eukprot:403352160